ncbi:PssD/Cps14F family polysaccharide biosynthesis glycosyltransferase [Mucilaginibacter sp.]|uniref:PssD/Cps14F family polysaccharide biosynthesis glycosyltransferase n=1 Tax=Mucilaginibacter sp. TaxID=1882438 RepID=UPI002840116B|nr:PssD/Cps14F family polysaccharide biosynthesis glycosyltransferase [Mucilaginibacter sp.]MDR3696313.1 PssD/Cps14F family polysaccharide biosynthesis glycosyltransferase [Mucilaginibacter sp.]
MKTILIPTSTGGHLNEVLQLKKLYDTYKCIIVTEDVPINHTILKGYNYEFVRANGENRDFTFWRNFIINIFLAFKIIIKNRPSAIVTTGSHTAVPFCYIGKLFGCKVIFILSFCRTTSKALSADLVHPIADMFFVQWEETKKFYKKAVYVGPVF